MSQALLLGHQRPSELNLNIDRSASVPLAVDQNGRRAQCNLSPRRKVSKLKDYEIQKNADLNASTLHLKGLEAYGLIQNGHLGGIMSCALQGALCFSFWVFLFLCRTQNDNPKNSPKQETPNNTFYLRITSKHQSKREPQNSKPFGRKYSKINSREWEAL